MSESDEPTAPASSTATPTSEEIKGSDDLCVEKLKVKHQGVAVNMVSTLTIMIALIAASAAIWSAYEARLTRLEDERPFLAMKVTMEPSAEKVPTIYNSPPTITLLSLGKTPSLHVRVLCEIEISWKPYHWRDSDVLKERQTQFDYLLPGTSSSPDCMQHAEGEPPPEGTPQLNAIVLGVVYYQGTDHRDYQTPFCYFVLQSKEDIVDQSYCPGVTGLPPLK
jgi:hypothetical protein